MTVDGRDHISGQGTRMRMSVLRGFNLVEVMVALLVVAVGFTALLASTSAGLHSAQKTNASLTSYVAAQDLVGRLEAHFRFPLDAIVMQDILAYSNPGTWNSAGNVYDKYYVPPKPEPFVEAWGSDEGMDEADFDTLYNFASDAVRDYVGLFPSTLTPALPSTTAVFTREAVGVSAGTIPNRKNSVIGDASDWSLSTLKPYPIGPYRLMVDFYEQSSMYETAGTRSAVPFRVYTVKVWVFPADFPRIKNTSGSPYDPKNTTGVANRNKELLAVYDFTVRLGKAIELFE